MLSEGENRLALTSVENEQRSRLSAAQSALDQPGACVRRDRDLYASRHRNTPACRPGAPGTDAGRAGVFDILMERDRLTGMSNGRRSATSSRER
jgi:hypothetical protein